uniref:Uncharacterized protein LOC100185373 n=1 Tax=Phallusia mammillata TaxID=59560 RepID=A0A6F9DHJ3_9ASCI|nr:uncharacterized protein LOC100185373 [Phallusia mammillata]
MPVCAGYNCHKRIQKGTSLFKFPKHTGLCKKWLECLGRKDLFDFSYEDLKNGGFRVCQKHFHVSDVYKKGSKTFLKKSALPTVQQYCSPNDILKESPFSYFTEEGDKPIIEPRKKKLQCNVPLVLNVKDIPTDSIQVDDSPLEDITVIYYCSIPMCSNNSQQQPHLKFHTLPAYKSTSNIPPGVNPLVVVWKKFLNTILSLWGMQDQMLRNQTCLRICSIHFKAEDFIIPPTKGVSGTKVILKATSFPSVDPLFESYLTAQKKLQEDEPDTTLSDPTKIQKFNSGTTSTNTIVLNSSQKPALVTTINTPSISSEKSTPIINLSPSTTIQQPIALGTALQCADGSLKMPISRLPNQKPPKTSYYLLPVICTKQETTQKMLLIPTANSGTSGTTQPISSIKVGEKQVVRKKPAIIRSGGTTAGKKTTKQTLKTIKILKPMNQNKKSIVKTAGTASLAVATNPRKLNHTVKPVTTSAAPTASSKLVGNQSNKPSLRPILAKPNLAPKTGTFLNLNDFASSNSLSNINLKIHGSTININPSTTKQDQTTKQPTASTQLIVSSGANPTVTLSNVQSDPFPSIHAAEIGPLSVLEKQIKIEENIVDPALQPFLLSTSRNETEKQDTFVANFLTDRVKRPSVTDAADLPVKRIKMEVEQDDVLLDVTTIPKESNLDTKTEDLNEDKENALLVTDNGPYAMTDGQPRCGRKPPMDHPWDDSLLEHVTYGLSKGQPKLTDAISEEDLPLDNGAVPQSRFCQYCSADVFQTKSSGGFTNHEAGHTPTTTYYCNICSDSFPSALQLHAHTGTHSADGRIMCLHCDSTFDDFVELVEHSDNHIDDLPLQCPLCYSSFYNKSGVECHLRKHIEKSFMPSVAVVNVEIS